MKLNQSHTIKALLLFLILVVVNILSFYFFERFDLTEDNRYTLSPAAVEIVEDVQKPLNIEVFLKGEFPAEFRKLQFETRQILEEFAAHNPNIKFSFINPLKDGGNTGAVASRFYEMGMTPARINVVENGRSSETIVFPWAVVHYNGNSDPVQLLINTLGATRQERITASVQQLQYAFADAFSKLVYPKRKKIAVMRGNGELP
ncbi:MAG TPA: Gldg family protein, partial [Salinimicrobium sp.]|nr:Gldg family protein [Salinimicrobium sp.]